MHSQYRGQYHQQLSASGVPLVVLDPTGEPVGATNWSGGIAAARHLIDLGRRRIAVITGPAAYMCSRARLEAARAALETAGVTLDPALVRSGAFAFDDGLTLGGELPADRAGRPPCCAATTCRRPASTRPLAGPSGGPRRT
ncbi:hypothetical protein [Dactylosporangium sp. CA-233914]|uniref:hypothetical protein n=1 Tax=Dactylosporangium sp. CA-233914 TaxID=3239934 RepID=UPI003D8DE8CA